MRENADKRREGVKKSENDAVVIYGRPISRRCSGGGIALSLVPSSVFRPIRLGGKSESDGVEEERGKKGMF